MEESKNRKMMIYEYLQNHTATGSMVHDALGIKEKYFTRVKRELEKSNRLWVVRIGRCESTRYPKTQYVSTNPNLKPNNPQLEILFYLG